MLNANEPYLSIGSSEIHPMSYHLQLGLFLLPQSPCQVPWCLKDKGQIFGLGPFSLLLQGTLCPFL